MISFKSSSRFLIVIILSLITVSNSRAASSSYNQINFSVTLSGHILIGIGYDYGIDTNNKIRATVWIAPEKGLPYAYSAGYAYLFNDNRWQPELGLEYMVITSPPLEKGRKSISLINLTPAVNYRFDTPDILAARVWLSYLLQNKKIAPTGLEFRYGRTF